jgi:folate-binding protein YgfZ
MAEYKQARSGAILLKSARGQIEVAGLDAATFLQNLTSNDIRALSPGGGCEAFLLTVKARVVAHLFVWRSEESPSTFWVDLNPGRAEEVFAHLDRHLISERVELTDRTAEFAQIRVLGPRAPDLVSGVLEADLRPLQPLEQRTVLRGGGSCLARRQDLAGLPYFDLLGPVSSMESLWQALESAGGKPARKQVFEVLRVEAGMPLEGVDFDENTFAPETGRIPQAISYAKGCYLGQEPVVMARDRGHLNRTLVGLRIAAERAPGGSLLYREGKEVGRLTSCVHSPRLGTAIALGYVRRGNQEPGTRVEVDAHGERLVAEVVSLPFVC